MMVDYKHVTRTILKQDNFFHFLTRTNLSQVNFFFYLFFIFLVS